MIGIISAILPPQDLDLKDLDQCTRGQFSIGKSFSRSSLSRVGKAFQMYFLSRVLLSIRTKSAQSNILKKKIQKIYLEWFAGSKPSTNQNLNFAKSEQKLVQ